MIQVLFGHFFRHDHFIALHCSLSWALFVCYQICEHGIFEKDEPVMMQINTSDSRGNFWDQRVKDQRQTRPK